MITVYDIRSLLKEREENTQEEDREKRGTHHEWREPKRSSVRWHRITEECTWRLPKAA